MLTFALRCVFAGVCNGGADNFWTFWLAAAVVAGEPGPRLPPLYGGCRGGSAKPWSAWLHRSHARYA